MRLRRKPWVRPELEKCKFFINSPCKNIGKWNKIFKEEAPIHIELGCR